MRTLSLLSGKVSAMWEMCMENCVKWGWLLCSSVVPSSKTWPLFIHWLKGGVAGIGDTHRHKKPCISFPIQFWENWIKQKELCVAVPRCKSDLTSRPSRQPHGQRKRDTFVKGHRGHLIRNNTTSGSARVTDLNVSCWGEVEDGPVHVMRFNANDPNGITIRTESLAAS